jgi:hypothetical protein
MRLFLEIEFGSVAPRSVEIEAGSEVRIGRMPPAQVVVSDQTVSRLHFAISFDGQLGRLRDLNSTHGTMVNGRQLSDTMLHDGDMIKAGMTSFRVRIAQHLRTAEMIAEFDPLADSAAVAVSGTMEMPVLDDELSLHDRVIRELRAQRDPLFAILDAARDPLILARLLDCKEEHESLYEGIEGQKLAAFAPYLVALPPGSKFLETIVRDGWGKSWGVYLTCPKTFKEVRKHLRQFLMVKLEGGEQVYFRFYDPRVLRVFLPTCNQAELMQFFGPVRQWVLEGADASEMLRLSAEAGQIRVHKAALVRDRQLETVDQR